MRSSKLASGVIVASVFALIAAMLAGAAADDAEGQSPVSAVFKDASPLVPGNEVKVSGVTVGEIVDVQLREGLAHVEMLVDNAVLPLGDDAKAIITPKDVLGERYITIERGSPDAERMAEPYVIDVKNTSGAVDVEDVLNTLDDPTSASAAELLTALGEGARGRGSEIAAAISELSPTMRQAGELARMLSDQNKLLTRLLDSTEPVAAELSAGRGEDLDKMVGSTEQVLSAIAADRQALADSLDRLPGTLKSAQRTLSRVAGVTETMTPSLENIRPITDDLTKIDQELRRFAETAEPALASLQPVLDRGHELIREAAPLVEDLRGAGADLRTVAASGRDLSEKGVSLRFDNLMKFVKFWALSTAGYDGLSHYFRASVPLTPMALGRTGAGAIPGAPDSPVPDLNLPDVERLPLPGTCDDESQQGCEGENDLPTFPDNGPTGSESPKDGVTGLSREQESSMLSQLLGGS